MPNNTEILEDGTEVYISRLYELADKYISTELGGDSERTKDYFKDMIFYISDRIPKIDNADIDELDKLFNAYVRLCTRYRVLPTLECFSFLSKINRATFTDWANGEYRVTTAHSNTIKKWFNICKSFLVDNLSNSSGTSANQIFIAKAAYNMVETAPPQFDSNTHQRALTAEELPNLAQIGVKNGVNGLPQL